MKKLSIMLLILLAYGLGQGRLVCATTDTGDQKRAEQDAKGEKPVGGKSGQKGGIYVVGRGFKSAGHGMEKGFKAAGRGIEKGGKATGHAFQKAGHATKNFFTGEKDEPKKNK